MPAGVNSRAGGRFTDADRVNGPARLMAGVKAGDVETKIRRAEEHVAAQESVADQNQRRFAEWTCSLHRIG